MSFVPKRDALPVAVRIAAYGLLVVCLFLLAALPVGCGSGDVTLAEADPEAVPQVSNWEQVFSIFQRECLPCHGPGGKEPKLETCADITNSYESSYQQIIQNAMPPGAWPRLTSEERLIIERFGGEAPCL